MSFSAINEDPSGETEIAPTALVFGAYSLLSGGDKRGTIVERANIIRQCTETVTKIKTRQVIRNAGRLRNNLCKEESCRVSLLPSGHYVLVYRENSGWIPYESVLVQRDIVHVILPGKFQC